MSSTLKANFYALTDPIFRERYFQFPSNEDISYLWSIDGFLSYLNRKEASEYRNIFITNGINTVIYVFYIHLINYSQSLTKWITEKLTDQIKTPASFKTVPHMKTLELILQSLSFRKRSKLTLNSRFLVKKMGTKSTNLSKEITHSKTKLIELNH